MKNRSRTPKDRASAGGPPRPGPPPEPPAPGAPPPSPAPGRTPAAPDLPPGSPAFPSRRHRIARGALTGCLALGLAVSVYLVDHHNAVMYGGQGGSALCNVSATFDCDAVNASEWSELFGVPIAAFAVPTYLVVLGLLWRLRSAASLTFTFALGLAAVVYSAVLAWISSVEIGAWCLFCMTLYAVNGAMLGLAWWASGRSFLGNLRQLVPDLRAERRAVAVAAGVGVVVLGVSVAASVEQKRRFIAETATAVAGAGVTPGPAGPEAAVSDSGGAPVGDLATLAGSPETRKLKLQAQRKKVPLAAHVPVSGPPKAPVTVALFEDFQCPFCKKLTGNVETLKAKYPGKLRIAFLNFPMHSACNATELKKDLHPYACGSARAGVCAQEQGRFWEMYEAMYRNNTRLKPKDLRGYAQRLGLDMGAFDACLADRRSLDKVLDDSRVGGDLGVSGTPALFINGRQLAGAQPVEVLSAVVEAELAGTDQTDFEVALAAERVGPAASAAPVTTAQGPGGPFTIDTFEASVRGGKAVSASGVEAARGVSWYQAKAACEAAGKRLCTPQEWMSACMGVPLADTNGDGLVHDEWSDGPQYGYGAFYQAGTCADARKRDDARPLVTGVHPECRTPTGLYDMVGNVKEWVGLTPDRAGVVGGSYFSGEAARCNFWKDDVPPDTTTDLGLGFRCCSGEAGTPVATAAADGGHPGGKVGDPLMAFTGSLLGGKGTFSAASLSGKRVILTFWASWCAPCRAELPALQAAYAQEKSRGLEIVGVNVDRDSSKGLAMARDLGLTFPLIADPDSALMKRFDTRGLPTTFWIDGTGVIRSRTVGFDDKRGVALVLERLGTL